MTITTCSSSAKDILTHGGMVKSSHEANDFFWNWRRNDWMNIVLKVDRPARLHLNFNSPVRLNDNMPRMSVAAVRLCLRGPQPNDDWSEFSDPFHAMPPEILGAFWRSNILPDLKTSTGNHDRDKYDMASISCVEDIVPPSSDWSYYRVEVWARARSTYNLCTLGDGEFACPGSDGNVRFDFDPYDAYNGTQHQCALTAELS